MFIEQRENEDHSVVLVIMNGRAKCMNGANASENKNEPRKSGMYRAVQVIRAFHLPSLVIVNTASIACDHWFHWCLYHHFFRFTLREFRIHKSIQLAKH